MAKRKSNRAARRLFLSSYHCLRISNRRRWQVWGENYPHSWQYVKSSRSQRRAAKVIHELFSGAQEKAL